MTEDQAKRILYKAARSMHDGVCAKCGGVVSTQDNELCMECGFRMTKVEQQMSLRFAPQFVGDVDTAM